MGLVRRWGYYVLAGCIMLSAVVLAVVIGAPW
jgi:hypothetical protein